MRSSTSTWSLSLCARSVFSSTNWRYLRDREDLSPQSHDLRHLRRHFLLVASEERLVHLLRVSGTRHANGDDDGGAGGNSLLAADAAEHLLHETDVAKLVEHREVADDDALVPQVVTQFRRSVGMALSVR